MKIQIIRALPVTDYCKSKIINQEADLHTNQAKRQLRTPAMVTTQLPHKTKLKQRPY